MDTTTSRPLLDRLKARTAPVRQAKRGPAYNHPLLWYAKPDGDVVKLQGDPQNRAYYEDKGYTVLRPDEVQEWEKIVRPKIVAAQRARAARIETIRRVGAKNPALQIVADLDVMTDEELDELLAQLGQATGMPVKVITGRLREEVVEPEDEDAKGATIGSGSELAEKLKRLEARAREGK